MAGKTVGDWRPQWYGVRSIICTDHESSPCVYEERVTIWQASTFEDAIGLAEIESLAYSADIGGTSTGLYRAFKIDGTVGHGSEVFSLVRESTRGPADYIDTFFDTGSECQKHIE